MFYLFLGKNDISISLVHKSRKWAVFGLTCKDKRSRALVTVPPIFKKIVLKDAQDSKKSQRAAHSGPGRNQSAPKLILGGFIFYKSRGNVWISRDFRLNFITNIFSDV